MSKRETIQVSQEEMEQQQQFIQLVGDLNAGTVKKYSISTFGCQMNEHDSEKLAGMLHAMGYTETNKVEESSIILYNTCCVRENAELKVYGHLGALKKLKEEKPDLVIAVCGCMMQQPEVVEHIRKKYRHVDLIFGTHNLHRFPQLLHQVAASREHVIDVWESTGQIAEGVPVQRKDGIKAWVTVMYGCNNFCAYCIVPYVRGRERSRSAEDILREVEDLGRQGIKEVTLLGQNVNSYGKDREDGEDFASLLRRMNEVPGIERIRFMTSHPKDLSDALIEVMAQCPKVCKHLHLPIQSGSTRVLEAMNRRYTKARYLDLVAKIRRQIPDIALTTDIIVGFPGETEDDFKETLDVMQQVRFDSAYTFLYSKRTGTPAAGSADQVPEAVMKERFERLLELQNTIGREINDALLGQEVEVLVEGLSKNSIRRYTGRTDTNKVVNFTGTKEMIGKRVRVHIDQVQTWSLEGTVLK